MSKKEILVSMKKIFSITKLWVTRNTKLEALFHSKKSKLENLFQTPLNASATKQRRGFI
jgi:hypothetical protein